MVFGPPNGGKNFPLFFVTFYVCDSLYYAEEILLANTYIGTDEAGNASGATICLICKKTLSNDLEEMIYETAASLIAVDRNNINIVVEVNYSPDGDANSEIEQDAADNDSVTYA